MTERRFKTPNRN